MKNLLILLIFMINMPIRSSNNLKLYGPDCSGKWPTNMTFALMKNAGLINNNNIIFSKTKTVRLASQKIGRDLWHQVYLITFIMKTGKIIEAIAIHNASKEECSMSDVKVYVISRQLR